MPRRPFPSILTAFTALAACAAPAEVPPGAGRAAVAPAETVLDPAADPDCRASLRRLLDAAARGPVRFVGPVPAAIVVSDAAAVEADLPLPVVRDASSSSAPCLIVIGPPEALASARVEAVTRAPRGRAVRERNPEYDLAKRRLRRAERRTDDRPKIIRTGDPLVDLIGAVAGGLIGAVVRSEWRQEEDEALAALAATPTTRVRPEAADGGPAPVVEVSAVLPVRLLDRARGGERLTRLRLVERRPAEGEEADGSRPPRPPVAPLSTLVRGVVEGVATESPTPRPAAAPPPEAGRFVRVRGTAGEGGGVYVAPYTVAAPAGLFGRSDVVDVTGADGGRMLGLIVERDAARDRAVIRVPREGPPAVPTSAQPQPFSSDSSDR